MTRRISDAHTASGRRSDPGQAGSSRWLGWRSPRVLGFNRDTATDFLDGHLQNSLLLFCHFSCLQNMHKIHACPRRVLSRWNIQSFTQILCFMVIMWCHLSVRQVLHEINLCYVKFLHSLTNIGKYMLTSKKYVKKPNPHWRRAAEFPAKRVPRAGRVGASSQGQLRRRFPSAFPNTHTDQQHFKTLRVFETTQDNLLTDNRWHLISKCCVLRWGWRKELGPSQPQPGDPGLPARPPQLPAHG